MTQNHQIVAYYILDHGVYIVCESVQKVYAQCTRATRFADVVLFDRRVFRFTKVFVFFFRKALRFIYFTKKHTLSHTPYTPLNCNGELKQTNSICVKFLFELILERNSDVVNLNIVFTIRHTQMQFVVAPHYLGEIFMSQTCVIRSCFGGTGAKNTVKTHIVV